MKFKKRTLAKDKVEIPHATYSLASDPNRYVKEFDRLNHLIPTPIIWVKVTHGNFA